MKKLFLIIALAMFTFFANAQIKVYSTGKIGLHTTTASAADVHVVGNTTFTLNDGTIYSAPFIRGNQNYSTCKIPDFTWWGNDQCGIFHPAANTIAFSTNGLRKATLDANGNFGIGDSTPLSPLTVGNGDLFQVTSSGYVRSINGTASTPTYSFTNTNNVGMYGSSGNLSFATNGTEYLRIVSNGAVLLGASGSSAWPVFSWLSDYNTGIYSPSGDVIGFSTGGTERMRINGYGDVSIGETNPLYGDRLTINAPNNYRGICLTVTHNSDGGHSMTSNVNRDGTFSYVLNRSGIGVKFYVRGDGYVWAYNGYGQGSDLSLKEDINTIIDPLQKVMNLRGVTYKLKKDLPENPNDTLANISTAPNPVQMGLIAQEVETVIPEVVYDMPNGKKAITYSNLIALLIEAIKAQQLKIEEQDEKLNIQDEKINALETEVTNCCNIKPTEKILNQTQGSNNTNNNSTTAVLYQNIPNPFKTKTTIRYYLPGESNMASLLVFDMNGKLIKTFPINTTGDGNIEINGGELQPGMYMYSLIANGKEVDTKKMILTE